MLRHHVAFVVVSLGLVLGCGEKPTEAPPASGGVSSGTTTVAMPTGLSISVPTSWKSQAASGMRQAQWKLPKADGDAEDADLTVFHFGAGQGGNVEANMERWYSQFQRPDGKSVKDSAKIDHMEANGLKITRVDISGTFVAPVMPGSAEVNNKAGYRMIAAVVEGTGGPWFLKLVGPEKTVSQHESSFVAALSTCKK
ncbi:MAG: hypothetical protein HYR85_21275 [Planctomycetes bacterium]|nr:hypothetical protein [Planctomycetota bacterium]MBI3847109.1 hypothetical protein [Planctomycetota bacterium]